MTSRYETFKFSGFFLRGLFSIEC